MSDHRLAPVELPVSIGLGARSVGGRVLLGVASWTFGAPGAALLTGLLFLAPDLASAWAWIFGGFWLLVAVGGCALELATGTRRG